MTNYDTLDMDTVKLLNTHYTKGRDGGSIQFIVLHHNAANLTVEGCWQVWQSRQASAHIQIEENGRTGQLVWDADIAWHAGNWYANMHSIGIEHADKLVNDQWVLSEATLDAGAHVVAAYCKYYKLGKPEWMKNVFPHSHFSATACPASIQGTQNAEYMRRAQSYYSQMNGGSAITPAPAGPTSNEKRGRKDNDTIAIEVIQGLWGVGIDRANKLSQAGYDYNLIQSLVNQKLGMGTGTSQPVESIDSIARAVINGEYGNGNERAHKIEAAGYDYAVVQAKVNQLLGQGSADIQDLTAVARRVIRGDFGNGDTRRARLALAGYDPAAVQARVNQLM